MDIYSLITPQARNPKLKYWQGRGPLKPSANDPSFLFIVLSLGRVQLFATLWTVVRQSPLPMGFSRQEYWRNHLQIKTEVSLSLSPDYRKLLMSPNAS